MDKEKETSSKFSITDGNPSELLEFEEEFFLKMAFFIKPPIDIPRISFCIPGKDTEICVVVSKEPPQYPFAIGLISEDGRAFQGDAAEQLFSDEERHRERCLRLT